jgi:hypothetical protein
MRRILEGMTLEVLVERQREIEQRKGSLRSDALLAEEAAST